MAKSPLRPPAQSRAVIAGSLTQAGELIVAIQQLSQVRTVSDVQAIVGTAARRLAGSDGATFVLKDGDHCHYADEDTISPLFKGQRFPVEDCISGWSMVNREPVAIEDIYADPRILHEAYRPTFVKSLLMVPIRTPDPIGAIGNYWGHHHTVTTEDLDVLRALADSTAVALDNIRISQELEASRFEMLHRLALAAEYRADATPEHTTRVAELACRIAEKMARPATEVALLRLAAPLHDIGKLGISDTLLLKPGKLTPEEFSRVKEHTTIGSTLLADRTSEVLRLAREIALTHHEWWNGSGYPGGLRSEHIPLSGRIVAVADVFDALVHIRPYKPAWQTGEAVAEISRLRGLQFDPAVVDAFLAVKPQAPAGHPAGQARVRKARSPRTRERMDTA